MTKDSAPHYEIGRWRRTPPNGEKPWSRQSLEYGEQLLTKLRQVGMHGRPNNSVAHDVIVVDHAITEANDVAEIGDTAHKRGIES